MTPDDPRHQHSDPPGADAHASRDELASALLDGGLTSDEAEEARRRPDVLARAAEMDAARSALRDVPSADAAARDRAVAAALAAFDADAGPSVAESAEGPAGPAHAPGAVTDLGAHRRARDSSRRWLGAAAAVAAVVVGVAGLAVLSSDGDADQQTADSGGEAAEESTSGDSGAADREPSATEAPSDESQDSELSAGTAETGDLGTFPSAQALADHVDALVSGGDGADAGAGGAEPTPPAPVVPSAGERASSADAVARLDAACAGSLPTSLRDPAALRLHGTALVDGDAVNVWVLEDGDGNGNGILAIDAMCTIVVDRPAG